jgi:RNA polymerase sigma-70 factor, ECF subfamily
MIASSLSAQEGSRPAECVYCSSIAQLTLGMAKRSETAFRQFHELYFDRLFRYQIVLARGDETAAADALQETFVRVIRYARAFETEEAFWSWLTVLARSAARDAGRKQQRYWRLLANYARSFLAPRATPFEERVEEAYWEELVVRGLDELKPEDRALIEGKYFRHASVRELAIETGMTEKAVESRLLRARRVLRESFLQKLNHEKLS